MPKEMGGLYALKNLFHYRTSAVARRNDSWRAPEELRLSNNKFSWGRFRPELSRLYSACDCSTSGRVLTGIVPDLNNCRKLRHLYLNDNQLDGKFPVRHCQIVGLNELDAENKLSGTILLKWSPCASLITFRCRTTLLRFHSGAHFWQTDAPQDVQPATEQVSRPHAHPDWYMLQIGRIAVNDNNLDGEFPYRVGRTLDTEILHLQQQGWRAYTDSDWWNGKLKRIPRPKQSV
jgi:hypothetical protein